MLVGRCIIMTLSSDTCYIEPLEKRQTLGYNCKDTNSRVTINKLKRRKKLSEHEKWKYSHISDCLEEKNQ